MGKALTAVGATLVLFFVVFGGVVYFTRDEDTVAVDPLLAESIGVAFSTAQQEGMPLRLTDVTPFEWDRVYVYEPGTPRSTVSEALGFEFLGDLPYTAESSEVFVFVDEGELVRFADYRGSGEFAGFDRPVDVLTPEEAVWTVSDGVARPAEAQ